jgi:catalase
VNDQGEAVLVKFHWIPKQGVRSLTTPEAADIQKEEFSHATKDLYDAIDSGNFPEWEFSVQIMADGEHPELDFDPLDDTKQWPESQFPLRKVGRMVLNKKPDNFSAESEQSAFGTGVKVDGIEFSADKMLQGRTFSYSDTQRYRVGPNYQQLPINAPKREVHTNQRDGAMTRMQDDGGANPHVNYEPSILGGVTEAPNDVTEYRPYIAGDVGRYVEDRTGDDYKQAGEIYRAFDDRHRNDLIDNLVTNLKKADPQIQERMVWHFLYADEDYGTRVAKGLGIDVEKARKLPPLPNKPAPGTTHSATDNVPGVKSGRTPYAASAASSNGGSAQKQNGNVAVMQRVFTTAEATGIR